LIKGKEGRVVEVSWVVELIVANFRCFDGK
jgi:hypothetical protein